MTESEPRGVKGGKARAAKLTAERRKEIAQEAANRRWSEERELEAEEHARWKRFGPHDTIMTAWAEPAMGPGWSNAPIWVLVRSQLDGAFRVECLQPHERSAEMSLLYHVSHAAHSAMTDAVRAHVNQMNNRLKKHGAQT